MHVCRKGTYVDQRGRNDRVKVNEEKGIEKECPRKGRIHASAREREKGCDEAAMGYSRGGREGEGGEASARINT